MQRGRGIGRGKKAPCGEAHVGLDPPGSWDHDLSQITCSTTQAPTAFLIQFLC